MYLSKPQDVELGVQGILTLPLKSTTLILTGEIVLRPADAGFEFKMDGMISKIFGLSRLHIGNIELMHFSYMLRVYLVSLV
jgi:hypothetical protein